MSWGLPDSVFMETATGLPFSNFTCLASMTMLIANALLVWRRHSVQWQQFTNIGLAVSAYFTAPQKHWPLRKVRIRFHRQLSLGEGDAGIAVQLPHFST